MERARILIIDDDAGLRKTLVDILTAKGYETFAAADGVEGVALLRESEVNVALVDLGLPDVSGIDVLSRIKIERPATETIILTGNATLDSAIEATNRGAFSYLQKPYNVDQLLLHIQRALEKQQVEERIVRQNAELERTNAELKVLHEVSLATSRTIDMDRLLADILNALAKTAIFPFEMKGAIFLVENGLLSRVSYIILHEAEAEPCVTVHPGECLCGISAATGEIIVSKDCRQDPRHTVSNSCVPPYGRIIVPLKAADRVVGVLSVYTEADVMLSERMIALLCTLGGQIGIAIENARLYEETKSSSLHDPLTSLANRRFMEIQMEKVIESAKRYGKPFSVIMMDIDHFKKYNDTHGHVEGDRLLAKIAGILSRDMRNADHVFRYGGEEFLAILIDTNLPMACEAAGRLKQSVEAEAGVTISLGVASYIKAADDVESLIRRADEALYRAKENGRNRVEVSSG